MRSLRWSEGQGVDVVNRPARFTTVDLRRALRAAAQAGPDYAVEIAPDGTIRITRDKSKGRASIELVSEEIVVF